MHLSSPAVQARSGVQAPNAWRIVLLLALANLLNFYDRTLPGVVVEPLKAEFGLTDTEIGIVGSVFTVVYAVAGIALGRIADRGSRRLVMGAGLILWSVLTAASGGAWSFASFLIFRMGIGIGEASFAPAANSLLADLFPPEKRSRAVAVLQVGLPLGLLIAFFTTGAIVEAFGSWRAPFLIASVPGVIIGVTMLFIKEPRRGAGDSAELASTTPVRQPFRQILQVPTIWWLILCGVGYQIAANGAATFLVPLFQRYFDLSLTAAGISAGIPLGVMGLIGLGLGGLLADRARQRSPRTRMLVGTLGLGLSAPIIAFSFTFGPDGAIAFLSVFSVGWLLQFVFHLTVLPAVAEVVEPRLRATALAVLFAAFYLFGGGFGPLIIGALSDTLSGGAAAGTMASAEGLHSAMGIAVPLALALAAIAMFGASRTINRDQAKTFNHSFS